MFNQLLNFLFGRDAVDDETQPITIQFESVQGSARYVISWQWLGHTYVYLFNSSWKSIVETKARISHAAATGCFSWDQATYAKELIDAMTEELQ